jgi:hypothetical protein
MMDAMVEDEQNLLRRWSGLENELLTAERDTWRTSAISALDTLRAQWDSPELAKIAGELEDASWTLPIADREKLIERVAQLQQRMAVARQNFLLALGPTHQPSLNSIVLQLELLHDEPDRTAQAGYIILQEINRLSEWASQLEGGGEKSESLRSLTQSLEQIAFSLLEEPVSPDLRERALLAWDNFLHEHAQERSATLLAKPTRSPRWNSWILLLKEVEGGHESPEMLLDALDALEQDLEEIEDSSPSEGLFACLQDFFEASRQLRVALEEGRKLKGWSQMIPPLLEEIDSLLTAPDSSEAEANSQITRLCQNFEDSRIDSEQFQRGLSGFRASLAEARRQANLATKDQDALEQQFSQALAKLDKGLKTLEEVESPGQGRLLEMGCALIEEGLEEIRQLQA